MLMLTRRPTVGMYVKVLFYWNVIQCLHWQFLKVKEIKHHLIISVPCKAYPLWLRKRLQTSIQQHPDSWITWAFPEGCQSQQRGYIFTITHNFTLWHLPLFPIVCKGDRYSPLKNLGGNYQIQISWKAWERMERDDVSKATAHTVIT